MSRQAGGVAYDLHHDGLVLEPRAPVHLHAQIERLLRQRALAALNTLARQLHRVLQSAHQQQESACRDVFYMPGEEHKFGQGVEFSGGRTSARRIASAR